LSFSEFLSTKSLVYKFMNVISVGRKQEWDWLERRENTTACKFEQFTFTYKLIYEIFTTNLTLFFLECAFHVTNFVDTTKVSSMN
jgi:hypothetical protein